MENKLIGYSRADGVHWYYDGKEIAIIDEATNEIEWTVRKHTLPPSLINEIKNKKNKSFAEWKIEVKRIAQSATQGSVGVYCNGELMQIWGDNYKDGKFESETKNPGDYIFACFWHKLDHVYKYSERWKQLFKPNWMKRED